MISQLQQICVTRDDQVRFDADSIDKSGADEFAQEPWAQGSAEEDFLSPIGPNGRRTLEFQRSAVLIGDQQASNVAATVDFHGFHEAQT